MAQVSYGTITITDTNDIERIYIEYCRSTSNQLDTSVTPPIVPNIIVNWSENTPSWINGQYIWQRSVIKKSGVNTLTYGTPVCLTGAQGQTGAAGRGLTGTSTKYCNYGVGEPADNYQYWVDAPPSYDSSKPNYWVKITNTYSVAPSPDIIKYKDEALTQAVYNAAVANSIAQNANENANGAMSQANNGIKEIYKVWYRTNTSTAPNKPPAHVISISNDVNNTWTKVKPIDNEDNRYYFYCDETVTNGGVSSWTDPVLDTSNLSQYEINALTAKVKNYWWNSDGAHIASGINGGNVDKNSSVSTYGFNSLVGLTGIRFGYNDAKVIDLNTTPSPTSLKFYQPPTISDSTVIQGALSMELSSSALKFYGSSTSTPDAILNSNGLKLTKGGIEAGTPGNNNFIYLSTNNYPLRQFISSEHSSFNSNKQYYIFEDNEYVLVENPVATEISNYYEISVEGVTINGYTPTEGLSDTGWRQIIGDKFGVDGEGNLYAGNAHISGSIEVNADSNVYDIQTINDVIYGVVAYIYNNNGQEEEVYKREDGTYYWIEINNNIEIIHEIEESELEKDEEDHLLIIRKADGIDTTVNNIATQLNNAQESISSLRNTTTKRIDNLADDNNTINNNLIQYNNRLSNLEGYVIINSDEGYIQVGGQNSRSYVKIDGVNAMVSINTIEKEKIAYISKDRFYAPSAVVTNLFMQREGVEGSDAIGEIGWVMRSNGNLSLKRIK